MERNKRSYGENKPERGRSPFKKREDSPRRERTYGDDSRSRRPRLEKESREDRPRRDYDSSRDNNRSRKTIERRGREERPRRYDGFSPRSREPIRSIERGSSNDGLIRLNKYISNSGICSRREADELIKAGTVSVNGEIVTEMGIKVTMDDIIVYGGEKLVNEQKKYLLLNKPKGFITTLDDPQKRKTVLSLISGACRERIYPVGRLDRNTTGLLLFTNDGEITKKLTHPSFGAKKIYHVELDKALTHADMRDIMDGVELEDGRIAADNIQYAGLGDDKKIIGIELHSGKNRIVRRIFASLGYDVIKLDRVSFAGLTKKNLPRGNYRFLSEQEVSFLKMLKAN